MFARPRHVREIHRSRTEHPFRVDWSPWQQSKPGCRLLAGREFGPAMPDQKLALAELEALAGALLPVLLAFLHA